MGVYFRELNVDKDVEIMSHDEETIQKTLHKVKFLKFNENTRPPYYGTWTKPTTKLSARNPFKQDEVRRGCCTVSGVKAYDNNVDH